MIKIATIFIVEDDQHLQKIYEEILSFSGFHVIGIAKNGAEAVLMYKSFSEKPNIILMDYRMPFKNGLEAAEEILQIDNKSKIIFASADKSIKDKALSLGAINFLCKPFKIDELIQSIKKVLYLLD